MRAVATLGLLSCACGPAAPSGAIRHVLLISLDTTRADHLSCYGAPAGRTPNIDALAREGLRFSDVTAAAPTTLASHSALMTGTYPHSHGVARNGFVLASENTTLAEVLRGAGFRTAAVLGSFALDRRFGFDQGFDIYDQDFETQASRTVDQDQRRAERVTDAALARLDELGSGPWFCFVHYFDAHAPYAPPAPWDAAFTSDGRPATSSPVEMDASAREHQRRLFGEERGLTSPTLRGFPADWVGRSDPAPAADDARLAALYAGEVGYVDAAVGRLLAGLRARGLERDTLVVLAADHGESFAEHHDFWNHGLWLYQSTVHVPLILRFPDGRARGETVSAPVSNIDVVPTLCELLGLAPPARCEGVSLVPAMRGAPFERGPIFSEATQPGAAFEEPGQWANKRKPKCVRSGPYKYVWCPYSGTEELFDLAADPDEHHDLLRGARSGEIEARRAELERELHRWSRAAQPLRSELEAAQREDTLQRLGELGYSEGAQER